LICSIFNAFALSLLLCSNPNHFAIKKIIVTFAPKFTCNKFMKRALAFILLISLLQATVQPTFAFHYCKGRLHSVSLVKRDLPKPCCEKNRPGCCSDNLLTIKTDSFSIPQTDTDIQAPAFPQTVFLAVNDDLILPCINNLLLQQVFPPGGLARYSAEVRHLFCIYRI
jgi:hypothetical protein